MLRFTESDFYMKNLCLLIVCVLPAFLFGQEEDLKIYGWKSYLPFQEGRYVTQSEDKIFYATEAAIVSIEKQTRAPEF
ncbi:MAG: hypothetical protein AAGK97_09405, partial [Bacteroidota bacterium]